MGQNVEFKLIYDSKGGIGGPEGQTTIGRDNFAVFSVSEITPYREGYVFAGWSYDGDNEVDFYPGGSFAVNKQETTIYAVWTKAENDVAVIDNAVEENVEPLGVVSSSSSQSSASNLGFSVGIAFILGAVFLGVLALILFRAREAKIISMEEIDED